MARMMGFKAMVNARGKEGKHKGEGMIMQLQAGINGKWVEMYTDDKRDFQGFLMKGAQINGKQKTLAIGNVFSAKWRDRHKPEGGGGDGNMDEGVGEGNEGHRK